jgi:hypothetical protein
MYTPKNIAKEAWEKMDEKMYKKEKKGSWRSPPGTSTGGPDRRPAHPVLAPVHRVQNQNPV